MKIYTKTGDSGSTGLFGGQRLSKAEPRIHAIGDVDELNAWLGLCAEAVSKVRKAAPVQKTLERVQGELFDVGAILGGCRGSLKGAEKILEKEIDALWPRLKPLEHFILPGGSEAAARLHLARTVCRRAERSVVSFAHSEALSAGAGIYLNRLSDYLFVAARFLNAVQGRTETTWKGRGR